MTATCLLLILFLCISWPVVLATPSSEHTSASFDVASTRKIINDISTWQKNYHQQEEGKSSHRPFVTVTYAQSLDGKIALLRPLINETKKKTRDDGDVATNVQNKSSKIATSSNYPISDPKSLRMTHALRSIHDGILVGSTTLAIDNPRLNNRLWKQDDDDDDDNSNENVTASSLHQEHQPRPIVLDTHLKLNPSLWRAQNVLVCCSEQAAENASKESNNNNNMPELLPCPLDPETGKMDLDYLLNQLKTKHRIQSIMVEGGSSVLSSFYNRPDLVDCLCITIAPKLLLWNGLSAINNPNSIRSVIKSDDGSQNTHKDFVLDSSRFDCTKFILLGNDSIFLAKMK